jgi:hypothetical protein
MKDGGLMIDYSEPAKGKRTGTHAEGIDARKFEKFPKAIAAIDADIMLEINDPLPILWTVAGLSEGGFVARHL